MALTGSGTSADPWIVHDWDELLETIAAEVPSGGKYIELANDISAPSTNTALTFEYYAQIDGKGYAINNLIDTVTLGPTISGSIRFRLKDISFTNVICDSKDFIDYIGHNGHNSFLDFSAVRVSGVFNSGNLFKRHGYAYVYTLTVESMALNIETQNGAFCLQSDNNSLTLNNTNAKIKYVNCTPQYSLLASQDRLAENCLFNIEAENATSNLTFGGKVKNCCFIGKGHGITIDSAEGVNVVEDTLPVDTTLPNVHSLTTAQIKNAQYLHNLGFPIGVD